MKPIFYGMTREQVLAITGEPVRRVHIERGGRKEEMWLLAEIHGSSSDPTCTFDENGKVIGFDLPH